MNKQEKDFCFCTLALGSSYRKMAKELASDLEKYSPGTFIYIYTDQPEEFREQKNILAFKHYQKGIQRCSNDRRLVIEKVLSKFPIAIHIDADTKLLGNIPDNLEYSPGITGCYENLIKHVSKYRPQSMGIIKNVASKLNIPLENANWIGESLYIVARDGGREKEFLKMWGLIASYLELKGMHGGDGNVMGLAAAKVGWKIERSDSWETVNKLREHLDASHQIKRTSWDNLKRRLGYHYRLNKARFTALKDFDFYYR
ncbi:MAG: hypothetical protein F6K10_40810 [Moorea sp. SIO2B7]|nr:hypothetical protein [Moorena sp. SIO2B7]